MNDLERHLRDRLEANIVNDPQVLLDQDGGPAGIRADVYLAKLIGHDDQTVAEIRVKEARDVVLLPIPARPSRLVSEAADVYPTIRTARFNLQSGYAMSKVDEGLALAQGLIASPARKPDFLLDVVLLRYRRDL